MQIKLLYRDILRALSLRYSQHDERTKRKSRRRDRAPRRDSILTAAPEIAFTRGYTRNGRPRGRTSDSGNEEDRGFSGARISLAAASLEVNSLGARGTKAIRDR